MTDTAGRNIANINLLNLFLWLGLLGIAFGFARGSFVLPIVIIAVPIMIISLVKIVREPIVLIYMIYTLNYFVMGINRYVEIPGVSFIMDILMFLTLVLIIAHSNLYHNIQWKYASNALTIGSLIWMIYCLCEVVNPSGMLQAWILSRGLMINGFIVSLVTSLLFDKYKSIKTLMFLYSVFSLMAAAKAVMQKFVGFDFAESRWLNNGGALTHLIMTGTRYFSFFTDAGNFGSNMGATGVTFLIASFYIKSVPTRVYYLIVSIAGFYAMMLSGTRGAMMVPLGGLAMFVAASKNVKAMAIGGFTLVFIYVFFAFTNIGQNNPQIRRMRTAFQPSEDASFNVRKENRAKLAVYLKNKPFGEGLGLSGVENQKMSMRLTTMIPHDSWYVKVWVETGIVGIILYLGFMFFSIGRGAWVLMFHVHNQELKGRLTGLLCGITGLLLSAYGNAFWGQFPTNIIAFVGLSLVLKGEHFDKELELQENKTE